MGNVFPRQPGDHIHINIIKSNLSCQTVSFFYLFHRVIPSNQAKRLIMHGLRIDADSSHPGVVERPELPGSHAIRTSRFHGKLPCLFHRKETVDLFHQKLQAVLGEGCRRPSSHIDGRELFMGACLRYVRQFFAQSLHISFHTVSEL